MKGPWLLTPWSSTIFFHVGGWQNVLICLLPPPLTRSILCTEARVNGWKFKQDYVLPPESSSDILGELGQIQHSFSIFQGPINFAFKPSALGPLCLTVSSA